MMCTSCGHHNEVNAKFCSECGTALAARCAACDAQQSPGSKFCNQCGTPMGGAPSPAIDPAPTPPSAVRKQVTALFADLVGSTAFGERVDPEAARAALAPYFEILQSTIEGHAGSVAKFTGDGVMAIFGVPEVAEDDALRAVAAGLELQRRFRGFADAVRDRHGLELGLRVGINTGELVIGEGDADLVGDVLNTAARLEAACQPGRVMVGEDTWRLTRSNVSYEVLGEVTVKGKAEALATFQVVDDDRPVPEDATPFVGRAAEFAALRSAFDDTVVSGVAKLVTVVGAPGVGKTRLAAELRAAVAVRSFDLRFERRGSTTFTPIAELLRELTHSGSADDVELLVADHAEAARLAGVLSSFLGHGDARSTEESFWAIRRLLEHLALTDPLVIVVDDIQWAESLFWDLLDHLVEWTEAPVLLVALARPELRELRPELTQAGRRVSAAVALEGLDADTTRELAARLLDTDELPGELIERIPASTEGNPLFVRELVQMLVDDGTLARDGERWHLTIDADAIEVPPTVLSLLASRVERLPDDERQVVELASVIGTEFDRGLLTAIAGADVGSRLGALIDRLRRKDLIEPSGTWAGDHPVYRFHHVLVRDAAYRRLLKGHRADLHERVGRYIDELGHDGDESDVVVAFHYEQAHRYRSELGTLDDDTRELARLAAGRLRVAADQALERDDLTASGSFAERALALTDDHEQFGELLLLGCEALLSSGDVTQGGALVDTMDRFERRDDRFDAWADCFRAQLWSLTDADRLAEAEQLADDAASRLDALDDQAGVAKARLVRAACLARLGRVGDCEDELDLALGAARAAGDRRRTVAVLGAAPLAALWGPSPVARAGGRCLDVLRLLRITTASPAVEATSVRCQGMLEALRGRLDSARTKLEQSRVTAREIGLRQGLFETELFAGLVELLDGDPVAAEPHLRAARDGLGRLGIGADAGQAAALLGRALLRQGRVDEADDLAGEALASAGQNLQTAMAARAVLAEVRSAQGRHEEAAALIADAAGIAERTDVIVDHALVELAGVVVADAAHDRAAAHRHRERARQLLDAKGVTVEVSGASTDRAGAPSSDVPTSAPSTAANEASQITNAVVELLHRVIAAILARDRSAAIALHAEDLTTSDSGVLARSVAYEGRTGAGSWVDFVLDMLSLGTEHEFTLEAIAVRGERLALVRAVVRIDGGTIDRLVVLVSDGSVVTHLSYYDVDQMELAHDELERRWADEVGGVRDHGAPENAATSASERAFGRLATGDVDGFIAEYRDDAEIITHMSLEHSVFAHQAMDTTSFAGRAATLGVDEGSRRSSLAVRAEHLSLARIDLISGERERTFFEVTRVVDGMIDRSEFFGPDQLWDAFDRLDELWLGADMTVGARTGNYRAVASGDLAAILGFLADDFESVDRRRLGHDVRDRERYAASQVLDDGEPWVALPVEMLRHEVRGEWVVELDRLSVSSGDSVVEMLKVFVARGPLITRSDDFDIDDVEAAHRHVDALLAALPGRPTMSVGNAASRVVGELWESMRSDDRERFVDGFRPEAAIVWRTSLADSANSHRTVGPDEWADIVMEFGWPDAADARWATVAVRADDLCLSRIEGTFDGDRRCLLLVCRALGGRLANVEHFGPDQLHDAIDRLDELWLGPDATVGARTGLARLITDGDESALIDALADDFESVDHRPLGQGRRNRVEFTRSISAGFEIAVQSEADERAVLVPVQILRREVVGDEFVELQHLEVRADHASWEFLGAIVSRGSHVARIEDFPLDDLDAANRRFDELAGTSTGTLANAAVAGVRAVASELPRDRELLAAHFAPDMLFHERRDAHVALGHGATRDRDGILDALLEVRPDEGSMSWHVEVIAIRGDDLCLVSFQAVPAAGFERGVLSIFEVRDGLVRQQWCYDEQDLRRAQEELDAIWFDSIGLSEDAPTRRRNAPVYAVDPDEMALNVHPELEFEDHRHISFVSGDVGAFLHNAPAMDLIDHILVPRIHRIEPHRVVAERGEVGRDGSTAEYLIVAGFAAGLVRSIDIYEPDDLPAALARYDDLGALVDDGPEPPSTALENGAWRLALAVDRAFRAGDRDAALALMHEEFAGDHREPLHTDATLDREQWVDEMIHHHHLGDDVRHRGEVVAIRGDDLVLIRNTSSIDGDDVSKLLILQTDGGQLINARFYEHDQLTEAQVDLDRRFFESLGHGPGTHAWDTVATAYEISVPDPPGAFLQRDFEVVDHRPLPFPHLDTNGLRGFVDVTPEGSWITRPRFLGMSRRTYAYERIEHYPGGDQVHGFHVVEVVDELVHRIDVYATGSEAMRRFEELEAVEATTPEVRNSASDAMDEMELLCTRADLDTVRDRRFHPDFVGRLRGPLTTAPGDLDRDGWLELIGGVLDIGGRYETEAVAVRSDDLALSRVDFVVGDDVSERLVVSRVHGGVVLESIVFNVDVDDLHDALDELDRLDTELQGATEFGDLLRRARRANVDGDRDAVRELLAPEFHIDDRRTLGIGDLNRDDYVRTSTRPGTTYLVREIVADTGRVALARSRWIAHDGSHWDQLDVVRYGGGRFEHIVLFDPDDLESARALFDELTLATERVGAGAGLPENEAAELGRRMHDLMMARDLDGLEEIIHPDFMGHSARRFRTMDSFSFDEFRQQWFALYDSEGTPTETTATTLAIRGDTLALGEITGESGDALSTSLALSRSADGRLAELWFFDAEDLRLALDELDQQFEASLDPVPLSQQVCRRLRAAIEANDRFGYRALLDDACVGVDHRRIGLGARSADDLAGSFPADDVVMVARNIIAIDDLHVLALADVRAEADDSVIGMLILNTVDAASGLVTSIETFDETDVEAALARFHELAHAGTAASAGEPVTAHRFDAAQNEAFRISRKADEYLVAGDRAGLDAIVHPDCVGHSRRSFRTWDDVGVDRFVDSWFDLFATAGTPTAVDSTLLATEGEHLCLEEGVIEFGDDVITLLVITRLDAGRIVENWFFDSTDLRSALDEFDRQTGSSGAASAPVVQLRRVGSSIGRGDLVNYRALLSDDLVSVDHRAIGLGTRTPDDLVRTAYRDGMRTRSRRVVAVDDCNLLIRLDMSVGDDDSEIGLLTLLGVDRDTCLITTMDFFDESDGDTALARFEELSSAAVPPTTASPVPTNEAVAVARRAHELFGEMLAGERAPDELLTLVHPTYRGHTEKRLRLDDEFDGDQFLAQWIEEFGSTGAPTRHDFERIAVRGSTLCLARLALEYGDDHLHSLFVTRIEDGLIAEHWWFEPDALHDALDLLDELWVASGDGIAALDAQLISRSRRLRASGTADDFRAVVTDDFVMRDHRRLGLGERGIDEYLASSGELFGQVELVVTDVLDWHGPVVLVRISFRLDGEDQIVDPQTLVIQVRRGDQIAVQESFDFDDLDAARRRFDEIVAERTDTPGVRRYDEFVAAWNDGDLERARTLVSDDIEIYSYRNVVTPGHTTGDEAIAALFSFHEFAPRWSSDLLDVRGDDLYLAAVRLHDGGGMEVPMVAVFQMGTDGRSRRVATFDPDDVERARDLLDRWHADRAESSDDGG